MKIKKININNFGILSKKSINLENGINIIYSDNKQLRLTIQNFIVCSLYGMDDDRKAFRNSFRRRYSPFSMEKSRGEMVVEKNNVEYLIERSFGVDKKGDSFSIHRVLDGEEFNNYLGEPGKVFLDIGFEAFYRTMFVRNIDNFRNVDSNKKLLDDIAKIKEKFDQRFSFDKSIDLINKAKDIIKNIKVSENLNELYEKYSSLSDKLSEVNEKIYLNSVDESKLSNLNKRKEILLNRYSLVDRELKHFKYLEVKKDVNDILSIENDINKLNRDMDNINEDIPKINNDLINKEFIDDITNKVEEYKSFKKEMLKIDKVDLKEESKALERFEYLNKELDRYFKIKSNFIFYSERVKKIELLNKEIDSIKGNGRLSYLLKEYKNISRYKKSKKKQIYNKIYIAIVALCILIALFAPTFNISISGIIFISSGAFLFILCSYAYIVLRDYKNIENKDIHKKAGKFYELKDQISKLEKEIYPFYYYKLRRDIENIKNIEKELDDLSFRFKNGDLSYSTIIKDSKNKEEELFNSLKSLGLNDMYIKDIDSFVENLKFKLDYKKSIEREIENKNKKLSSRLNGRNKYDLVSEMESLEEYKDYESDRNKEEVSKEIHLIKSELKEIDEEIEALKINLKSKSLNKTRASSINDEMMNLQNTILYLENKITNIDSYINKITDIYYEFKDTLSPEISDRIDYLIKYLTKDSLSTTKRSYMYDKDNSSVLVREKLGIEFLNVGMWDLIYFALRITVADLIYEYKGEIPLILDDIFSSYDLNRMKKALMLLEKYSKDRQVILFSSTKREIEYLKGNAYVINV